MCCLYMMQTQKINMQYWACNLTITTSHIHTFNTRLRNSYYRTLKTVFSIFNCVLKAVLTYYFKECWQLLHTLNSAVNGNKDQKKNFKFKIKFCLLSTKIEKSFCFLFFFCLVLLYTLLSDFLVPTFWQISDSARGLWVSDLNADKKKCIVTTEQLHSMVEHQSLLH